MALVLMVSGFLGIPRTARSESFTWSNGVFTTLNFPSLYAPAAAVAINDSGKLLVSVNGTASYLYANGSLTPISDPNYPYFDTQANDINNSGQIVGFLENIASNTNHGFLETAGSFTTIDYPGTPGTTTFTDPTGINNHGQIVGTFVRISTNPQLGIVDRGDFLYSSGVFTQLAIPGDPTAPFHLGINDAGQIVGGVTVHGTSIEHGFIDNDGVFTIFDVPGATQTSAFAINNLGEIVGSYLTPSEFGLSHGFLYANGSFTTIDFPGGVGSTSLLDINNAGRIVGTFDPSIPSYPLPEPPTAFLLAPALAVAFRLVRRRSTVRKDKALAFNK